MPIRQIVFADDPSLRKKSRHVRRVNSPDLKQLIDDMVETMHAANGIGLAAIQVGVPQRVITVKVPEVREEDQENKNEGESEKNPRPSKLYVIVNPKIARQSREIEEGIEGCLSIPGWVGEVPRHRAITVKGQDRHGRDIRIKAEGLLARIFQHEIDHCEGILFTDHIEDPEKIWPVTEGEEEAAEAAQEVPEGREAAPPESLE
jgi:peptide deformylase